jgi:U4/U6.U5 tri-snRNP-associated protein 2
MHSLEEQHHVYISLKDCKIWCLPDNYEVEDASLNDIKYNLMAIYTQEIVDKLDNEPLFSRALDGTDYYPGCLGLNNLK